MSRLVIIGEANPYGQDPRFALYHLPRRASGDRLREHLGLTDETYEALTKVNLCTGKWDTQLAKARAAEISAIYSKNDVILLLGVKVRKAFTGPPVFGAMQMKMGPHRWGPVLISIPHPSGLCREWDHRHARANARGILALHAPWVPWGETSRGVPFLPRSG